tara:strand:- start:382 stop:483 length:102 start_codon:yes stop_codon:yes gene_type:complete
MAIMGIKTSESYTALTGMILVFYFKSRDKEKKP